MFWCDSTIVLAYIKSTNKRYTIFISNRLGTIWATTQPNQWNYEHTSANPADIALRGLTVAELLSSTIWLHEPELLYQANYMNAFTNTSISDVEINGECIKRNEFTPLIGQQQILYCQQIFSQIWTHSSITTLIGLNTNGPQQCSSNLASGAERRQVA